MEISPNLSEKAIYDCKLVVMARLGDQKAFAELLGRYRDSIYFMLLKMVNNKSDADDLTIEAFGKAFKSLHLYEPEFAFSTWLFKIATNNCIDYLRKVRANKIPFDQYSSEDDDDQKLDIESDTLDPEEKLICQQREKLLKTVVSKLKPRYRRLIELRYFHEMSYDEISAEVELPPGTIKAQLYRARDLLYNIIKHSRGTI